MSEGTDPAEERRLVLPTLIVAISSIDPPNLIIGITLIEVAATVYHVGVQEHEPQGHLDN